MEEKLLDFFYLELTEGPALIRKTGFSRQNARLLSYLPDLTAHLLKAKFPPEFPSGGFTQPGLITFRLQVSPSRIQ